MLKSQAVEWLTSKDVAEILRVYPTTLANWRMRGYGPPFIKMGRSVRYRLEDVQEWQAQFMPKNGGEK